MIDAIAVLSDVHGNLWALGEVLADVRRRGIERVVNLGDSLYGPLDPSGTAERLMNLGPCATTIRGNQDRIVGDPNASEAANRSLAFTRRELLPEQRAWLSALPATGRVSGGVYLCHGTPKSDEVYLLEAVSEAAVTLRPSQEIERLLEGVSELLILCGHTHIPRCVAISGGRLTVNPGSVGLPAYADDFPHPHSMEAGSPHARYAVVWKGACGWNVELHQVAYDWNAASRRARENGREDWAQWLLSGRG